MRMWTTLVAALMLAAATHAGAAEQVLNWVEYQSPDRGFAATFPHSPEATSAQVAGLNPLTRYSFRASGRDYTNVGEFDTEPGKVVSIWYDRTNPEKARTFKSKVEFGWTLIFTALIPFGFWLIDIYVIPLP